MNHPSTSSPGLGASGAGRSLRILFFMTRAGYLRRYASLVSELARRGHRVHLSFARPPKASELEVVEPLIERFEEVTYGPSPRRGRLDGWRSVAWIVRGLPDLARYAHPRYDRAPVLRRRMAGKVSGRLSKPGEFEPIGRRLALRVARRLGETADAERSGRVIATAARLEAAVPASGRVTRYLREQAPDVVLATPVVNYGSEQVEFLKSARRLRIPAATCVASWDNLTNKGLLKFVPERVFVWNDVQRREATELHGMPADRVRVTGAQLFDDWFERRPKVSREEFARRIGIDSAHPYLVYVCSSPFVTRAAQEIEFVTAWIEALRSSADGRIARLGAVVRPHPNKPEQWRDVDLGRFGNAVVWPPTGSHPVDDERRADFFETLFHSAAVVGVNTTAMIEAAIVGRSVLTVLEPEFAQETTLHFHYLLAENGGFLSVASSFDDHVAQVSGVLDEDRSDAERRRRFVEEFVRPCGLDRPATPILADAVEELAGIGVVAARTPAALRALLTLEAALSSLTIALAPVSAWWERSRRRRRRLGIRRRLGAARRQALLLLRR